jgi:hypothetical protein
VKRLPIKKPFFYSNGLRLFSLGDTGRPQVGVLTSAFRLKARCFLLQKKKSPDVFAKHGTFSFSFSLTP